MEPLSYGNLDVAEVILALWKNAQPVGNVMIMLEMAILQNRHPKTLEDVRQDLQRRRRIHNTNGILWYDYLWGKPIKLGVDLERCELHRVDLYDRNATLPAATVIARCLQPKPT